VIGQSVKSPVTESNFGALHRSETTAARLVSHERLVIVCRPQIETSKVSTLLSTKTSYDDVRRQQDERRSDVQKSKRIKTVKLTNNVKITQEHLSMRQPQAAPPVSQYAESARPRKGSSTTSRNHDGLCLYYEPSLHARTVQLPVFSTFEVVAAFFHSAGFNAVVVVVY